MTGKYTQIYNVNSGSEKVHLTVFLSGCSEIFAISSKMWHRHFYKEHKLIIKGRQYIANTHLALFNQVNSTTVCSTNLAENISKTKQYISLLPGGGAGDFKRWKIEHFCHLVLLINKSHTQRFVFVLGPDEKSYIEIINSTLKNKCKYEIKISLSYAELLQTAKNSILTIANDCGPMHLYQMIKAPIITLWGWSDEQTSPYAILGEWFYATNNSWPIFPPEEEKSIQAITVERVHSVAMMELNRKTD